LYNNHAIGSRRFVKYWTINPQELYW